MRIKLRIINEAKREENSIRGSLYILLLHMLKCKYQYDYPYKSSWRDSIFNSFDNLIGEFDKGIGKGSLYNNFYIKKFDLNSTYDRAVRRATVETKLPKSSFPNKCEWTKESLVDEDFIYKFIEEYGYGPKEV